MPNKKSNNNNNQNHGDQSHEGIRWHLLLGIPFFLTVLVVLSIALWQLSSAVDDQQALPIESVMLQGQLKYTSAETIQQVVTQATAHNFFKTDIVDIQQAIEDLPWVYQAAVRREWPQKLRIQITEQQPIAQWNGTQWLNSQGHIFDAPTPSNIPSLPQLSGDTQQISLIWETYAQLHALLMTHNYQLLALDLNPRQAWRAELTNGVMLELGREDKVERIQRFIEVYPKIQPPSANQAVAYVDLRYDTGLAVGWYSLEESR